MGKKRRAAPAAPAETFSNRALAGLAKLAGTLPAAPAPPEEACDAPPADRPAPADPLDLSRCAKLVLRRERSGRHGKTVTVLSGLPAAQAEPVAVALRRALGCGGSTEAGERPGALHVVLQGDVRERATAWLSGRGARGVVRG